MVQETSKFILSIVLFSINFVSDKIRARARLLHTLNFKPCKHFFTRLSFLLRLCTYCFNLMLCDNFDQSEKKLGSIAIVLITY